MIKNILFSLVLIFNYSINHASNLENMQSNNKSAVQADEKEKPTILSFIPENYSLLDSASGDINQDSITDILILLKLNGEDTLSYSDIPVKRPALILLGKGDQNFSLAARNDNLVLCYACGGVMGDPYMSITLFNGSFSISHYGGSAWRWSRTVTFIYSPSEKNWLLETDTSESFHVSEPEKISSEIKTAENFGKIKFEFFDIYNE